jgi:zinc transporter ZupT
MDDENMYDDVKTKSYIALAIFAVSLCSTLAPLKVVKIDEHLFSAGNLLASGVLLSAGLVHQLPDSIEKLRHVHDSYSSSTTTTTIIGGIMNSNVFPIAPFITGLTFCLFFILEEYLHAHFNDHPLIMINHNKHDNNNNDNDKEQHQHHHDHNYHNTAFKEDSPLLVQHNSNNIAKDEKTTISSTCTSSSSSCSFNNNNNNNDIESGIITITGVEHHDYHYHKEHIAEHMHGSLVASVILLLALSVHSIFDGLAIGVSSKNNEVISITAAVLAHKGFAGYALGSSLVASEMNVRRYYIMVLIFSSCSVIGIYLGICLEALVAATAAEGGEKYNNSDTLVGIIQAIVAGTFLYVSIVEIGLKEILVCRDSKLLGDKIDHNQMQRMKLLAFLIGYLAMSSLAVFI